MSASIDVVLPPDERYTTEGAGAVATVTLGLAQELLRLGIPVRVLTPRAKGALLPAPEVVSMRFRMPRSLPQRLLARAGRLVSGPARDPLGTYRDEAVARVVDGPSGAVVVHNDPALAAVLSQRCPDLTVVVWLHNMIVGEPGRALISLPPDVRIVSVSDAVRRWTAETYGLRPERITVIHNGVDLAAFHPPARSSARSGRSGPLRVVCHGRIDPNKGQVLAARAVAALRAEGVAIDLTIIGAVQTFGMPEDEVRAYEGELSRAARAASATLTGWVPGREMPDRLRTFDVALVLPAVPEPFALTGLEAMASGCAVVAVPLGGVAEWVGDAAMCVDPTPSSVADALRLLATEPDALLERQQRSRRRAEQFGWDRAAERLVVVLDGPEVHG